MRPAPGDAAAVRTPGDTEAWSERYHVQFTASQEYADLLERAQDRDTWSRAAKQGASSFRASAGLLRYDARCGNGMWRRRRR